MINKSNTEHTHRPRLRHAHKHAGAHEHGPEAYGQQAPKTSTATTATPERTPARAAGQWWDRHVLATVILAIVAALALIAVFTPTGETSPMIAPLAPTSTATARDVVRPPVAQPTSTSTPRNTATPEATPCRAPTLPYCETPPTEQARPVDLAPTGPTFTPDATATGASIGGTLVPVLHCQEDEIIGYVANDVLGCVHVEGRTLEPTNPNTY